MPRPTQRPRPFSTLAAILALWALFYCSFTLFTPALLDDADSVHAEVAREMLLRRDPVTLYANGIRYLEKAPVLYWSMAASMEGASLLGANSPRALAAACRFPLALTVLALALLTEAFARRLFTSTRAGLYAALITLSSFGIFLFTRITLPDADVCLWLTLALLAYSGSEERPSMSQGFVFGLACALGVLSKGLIGLVFPLAIVVVHTLFTHGRKRSPKRFRQLPLFTAAITFLLVAAPWHILAGLANPTVGTPAPFRFAGGHWQVPLPTYGNVHGWFWFYFMNEHLLRYLNLRVPHDYDTSPLWLFWGLCFVWTMPWSAFAPKAFAWCIRWWDETWRSQFRRHDLPLKERGQFLLATWAAVVLLFFSLSTRQEYYVLPALPAISIAVAGWLAHKEGTKPAAELNQRAHRRSLTVLFLVGVVFAMGSMYFLLHSATPTPGTDLAALLKQNPADYALSMGHFLDLNAKALGLFRVPLTIAALSLLLGPFAALLLSKGPDSARPVRLFLSVFAAKTWPSAYKLWAGRKRRVHAANLALATGAFGFLLAAHLGLQTFAPVLSSAQLAESIASQIRPEDLIAIHGEYEAGSTLGFYLQRDDIHILNGRSSNLWYGSFFPDSPRLFDTPETLSARWNSPQRVFLWQSETDSDAPMSLPDFGSPVYVLARSGGKVIVSNQPSQ